MKHRIFVQRDRFKFSCAHMTVFPDGSKERLHGHNYKIGMSIGLTDISLKSMIHFNQVKDALGRLCDAWKEHVILAEHSPHVEWIRRDEDEIEFRLCSKRYVLPAEDALLLPIENVSVETLSGHALTELISDLSQCLAPPTVSDVEVSVEETPGQGASAQLFF